MIKPGHSMAVSPECGGTDQFISATDELAALILSSRTRVAPDDSTAEIEHSADETSSTGVRFAASARLQRRDR
jgi:hypothetical protein